MGQPGGKPGYVYEWVAQDLAARIESGELAPHTPLPSERRLAQEYGVSLGSARHATRLLRFRGLVVTVKSKGTYVADRARN
ncbi:winged helix-turn-helix transcriptional regulator [Amycolatopsis acidiphila]|uniref:Winged helix-turn-helix transcriptional regulator n=2 Tax=Amycolatopsis acidiphila TaxID=715473 RepID=A0A558AD52_9PSEU|nr:winged helix-turn-helix transcriptional regulator [Amycolatopsis acidiphila]